MTSIPRRWIRVVLCACLELTVLGCGHPPAPRESVTLEAREVSEPLFVEQAVPFDLPVPLDADEPLDQAFNRAMDIYRQAGLEPFDARRAYATSSSGNFARYFTVTESPDSADAVNHVVFVITAPWSTDRTREFLLSYLVMAAAPPRGSTRHEFHFHSAYPPPFAVSYLFSGTPQGGLEAAILSDLGTQTWQARQAPEIASHLATLLERYGWAGAHELEGPCPAALDLLYLSLSRPGNGEPDSVFGIRFLPEGTLAAIGLLIGESIRRNDPDHVAWEADDVSTVYPRLHISGMREGIFRPSSMMIELFMARADVTPTQYCLEMVEELSRRRGDEPKGSSVPSGLPGWHRRQVNVQHQ